MATFRYKAYTTQGAITAGTIVAEGVESFLREWRPDIAHAVTFESLGASDVD